jgi:hypothetical protein
MPHPRPRRREAPVMKSPVLAVLMAFLFGGAALLVAVEARHTRRDRLRDELLYYPSGVAIEKASLGHQNTAADIAWLRAIQYYGEHKRSDRTFTMTGHIFDIITDLDPQFVNAYIFGGLVTAEDAGDVQRGVALMEKGVRHNPESWQMAFETGFVEYVCARDYANAARHFRKAAGLPGAPESAQRFAAFVSARAGDPRAALYLWSEFAQRTTNAEMRKKAMEQIEKLRSEMKRDGD